MPAELFLCRLPVIYFLQFLRFSLDVAHCLFQQQMMVFDRHLVSQDYLCRGTWLFAEVHVTQKLYLCSKLYYSHQPLYDLSLFQPPESQGTWFQRHSSPLALCVSAG